MSEKYTVELSFEHRLTFEIDADSAYEAYTEASSGYEYGDVKPETEEAFGLELERIKIGGREIEITKHLDYRAPKDERGLSPWKYVARDASRTVGEGADLESVLAAAFSSDTEASRG